MTFELPIVKKKKRTFNPKDVPRVKKILNFLNEIYPLSTADGWDEDERMFAAYYCEDLKLWHICCSDISMYLDGKKFKILSKGLRKKNPNLRMIFCGYKVQTGKNYKKHNKSAINLFVLR